MLCNITLSRGSKLATCADDIVLYKLIDVDAYCFKKTLQWTESNHLNRKVVLLSRKCHNLPPMFIDQHDQIEQVSTYKYLGLIIILSVGPRSRNGTLGKYEPNSYFGMFKTLTYMKICWETFRSMHYGTFWQRYTHKYGV